MSSSLILSLIILAVLAGSLWYIIQAEGGALEIPRLLERVGIETGHVPPIPEQSIPPSSPSLLIPLEFQSGNSRFSKGSCTTDADCTTGGCSGESCISVGLIDEAGGGFVTTCEFSPEFPNAQGYTCGCVNTVCGWK